MTVEETMWDVRISRGVSEHDIEIRNDLARAVEQRLPYGRQLVRVVGWNANAGGLFAAEAGVRRFAVAYEVRTT